MPTPNDSTTIVDRSAEDARKTVANAGQAAEATASSTLSDIGDGIGEAVAGAFGSIGSLLSGKVSEKTSTNLGGEASPTIPDVLPPEPPQEAHEILHAAAEQASPATPADATTLHEQLRQAQEQMAPK
jgi:hypothetical protein